MSRKVGLDMDHFNGSGLRSSTVVTGSSAIDSWKWRVAEASKSFGSLPSDGQPWSFNVGRVTRSGAFLSRLLEAGVDVRFCDLPQIEGPTGRFILQQMVAVAELEAELIGDRTRNALAS